MHDPILIHHFSPYFSRQICFEDFNTRILFGGRIALIGHYDNYREKINADDAYINKEKNLLKQQQKLNHIELMKEQSRAAKSREKGKRSAKSSKWSPIIAQKMRVTLSKPQEAKALILANFVDCLMIKGHRADRHQGQ